GAWARRVGGRRPSLRGYPRAAPRVTGVRSVPVVEAGAQTPPVGLGVTPRHVERGVAQMVLHLPQVTGLAVEARAGAVAQRVHAFEGHVGTFADAPEPLVDAELRPQLEHVRSWVPASVHRAAVGQQRLGQLGA